MTKSEIVSMSVIVDGMESVRIPRLVMADTIAKLGSQVVEAAAASRGRMGDSIRFTVRVEKHEHDKSVEESYSRRMVSVVLDRYRNQLFGGLTPLEQVEAYRNELEELTRVFIKRFKELL